MPPIANDLSDLESTYAEFNALFVDFAKSLRTTFEGNKFFPSVEISDIEVASKANTRFGVSFLGVRYELCFSYLKFEHRDYGLAEVIVVAPGGEREQVDTVQFKRSGTVTESLSSGSGYHSLNEREFQGRFLCRLAEMNFKRLAAPLSVGEQPKQ